MVTLRMIFSKTTAEEVASWRRSGTPIFHKDHRILLAIILFRTIFRTTIVDMLEILVVIGGNETKTEQNEWSQTEPSHSSIFYTAIFLYNFTL